MSERTASEKYLIEQIHRERDRADRYEAEFCACKALLIAAQQRAERAEAERAEARAALERAREECALTERPPAKRIAILREILDLAIERAAPAAGRSEENGG